MSRLTSQKSTASSIREEHTIATRRRRRARRREAMVTSPKPRASFF